MADSDSRLMTRIDPRILCTDPRWVPVPSAQTDVTRTFERAREDLASGASQHWPVRYVVETREVAP